MYMYMYIIYYIPWNLTKTDIWNTFMDDGLLTSSC